VAIDLLTSLIGTGAASTIKMPDKFFPQIPLMTAEEDYSLRFSAQSAVSV
jgi:hypothetical protein